ncbi:MAG TPA: hypothetical protein VGX91_07015 [Candidatus Cybelea sp.]|jgi:hypothetical protein|nr:hypothetical protein [Candidatus Cybelea sp.]
MYTPKLFSRTAVSAALAAAVLCLALPGPAGAQESVPGYGTQPVPGYGTPVAHQEQIKGVLTGFDGTYTVYMRDDRGFDDHVSLHQGTMINPTGIKLVEGMRVTMWGNANGSTFEAYRIDVGGGGGYYPDSSGYGYGGYGGYGYGGGYYPGGYGYGYGGYPWGVSLGFGWGWGGPWGWGYPYGGYYGYPYGGYYGRYPYGCCYRGPWGWGNRGPWRGGTIQGGVHGAPGGAHGGVSGGGRAPVSGGRPPHR